MPTWQEKAKKRVTDTARIAVGSDLHLLEMALTENEKPRGLVKQGEAVVKDFMPNIKNCVIQDYGRMSNFLVEASKVQS